MRGMQERERRILLNSYQQPVTREGTIRKYVFRGVTDRVARRVLGRLENRGFIVRDGGLRIESERLIRLTSKGVKWVESIGQIRIPQRRKPDASTLIHDAAVSAVRFRLEELWDGTWIPEALLKSEEYPQIPDGIWIFPNGNRVAIEVERTAKGPQRFHRLQERWRHIDIRLVLYVATDRSIAKTVRQYLETGPSDLPFGLVELQSLEFGLPAVWTRLQEIELFTRRSF